MSEILEGVLSETILDTLASDLGIEADVLRKHPFFRVLRGRVLLTYPLRVPEDEFEVYAYYAALAAGATFELPEEVIVYNALLLQAAKLEVYMSTYKLLGVPGAGIAGHVGPFMCQGPTFLIGFKNTDAAQKALALSGLDMR